MIIDLIDKLLDRIIDLINYRHEVKRSLLDDYINPIFYEFELVHKEYLIAFEKYRDLIQSNKYSLNENSPILDIIKKDNLFSMNRRAKIFTMIEVRKNDNPFRNFIESIYYYLMNVKHNYNPYLDQVWFNGLLYDLTGIFSINSSSNNRYPNRLAVFLSDISTVKFDMELPFEVIVDDLCDEFFINKTDPEKYEKLKKFLSINSIDNRVKEMQNCYQNVAKEYNEIRNKLL